MVEAGMTPEAALISATSGAAEALGIADEVGSLAPGMQADIIAITGDPAKDVHAVRHVRMVMRAGRIEVDRREQTGLK